MQLKEALNLIKLRTLRDTSKGSSQIKIGLIDGPIAVNHAAFQGSRVRTVYETQPSSCKITNSIACRHGTFVAGILAAKRESLAPALCPNCEIVLRPVFSEETRDFESVPVSTPKELAIAIIETVDAGVKIINLSLGLSTASLQQYNNLENAYDYARQRGVILVAASGNQGNIGYASLLNHPWIIPVAACDARGRLMPNSNIGSSIGKHGLMAPGENILSASPNGKYTHMSGTSAAAPFVTGAVALLWSAFPTATANEIKFSILKNAPRSHRKIIPPILNAETAWKILTKDHRLLNHERSKTIMNNIQRLNQSAQEQRSHKAEVTPAQEQDNPPDFPPNVPENPEMAPTPSTPELPPAPEMNTGENCPTCDERTEVGAEPESFIYAIGTIEARFPSMAIENEFAQALQGEKTANLTDDQVMYRVLKANRYLAREVCWVLNIEGIETYILLCNDLTDLDQLIEAIKPGRRRAFDCDVVIGVKGPIAQAEMCNGLQAPIVAFDRIYSFDIPMLIKSIPKPDDVDEKVFRRAAEELFYRIQQMADNVGAMDEHRALNYLVVRYPRIYDLTAEKFSEDFSLTDVEVMPSRLTGVRKLLNVVLSYTSRKTDVTEKYYVRVDVSEKYPFLLNKLAPFYDR